MSIILIYSLAIAFVIQFIHALFWEGMIFGFIGAKLDNLLPSYIRKPLYDCPICMAPWWGSVILFFFSLAGIVQLPSAGLWVTTLLVTGGINVILSQIYKN